MLPWGDDATLVSNYGTGGDPAARGERTDEQPAPTITSKADRNRWRLRQLATGTRPNATRRTSEQPSPALAFGKDAASHVWTDPGVTPAGVVEAKRTDAVRLTAAEAACLQTFPTEYEWRGTKTQQFQQIGNAIPPLMAEAILCAVTGRPFEAVTRVA